MPPDVVSLVVQNVVQSTNPRPPRRVSTLRTLLQGSAHSACSFSRMLLLILQPIHIIQPIHEDCTLHIAHLLLRLRGGIKSGSHSDFHPDYD